MKKRRLSMISTMHYIKLVYRSVLFLLACVMYVISRAKNDGELFRGFEKKHWLLLLIWVVYAAEMISRFFPSRLESMGCQKQFQRNYKSTGSTKPVLPSWKGTATVALSWFALNGVIAAMYVVHWIDEGILVLVSLAYGVCDMICILFFCPFQTWFMKNRCCSVCRIYNWDFAMMFTPFLLIPATFTWSLLAMSLLLLLRWEITYWRHPERFAENTNASLSCANCQEKLCHHKTQLRTFWKQNKGRIGLK